MDRWLKNTALQAESRTARTYVVCPNNSQAVVGYYCLATGSVARAEVGNALGFVPDPVPAMVLGRLAVDLDYEGKGIGGGMLKDALQRTLLVSQTAGVRCILIHAIDEDAVSFYKRYEFLTFPTDPKILYLPIETIAASLT